MSTYTPPILEGVDHPEVCEDGEARAHRNTEEFGQDVYG